MVAAERDLAPKVDGLKPKFKELYSYYLGGRGLMFSGDTVVENPEDYNLYDPPADVGAEQRVWVDCKENFEMLCTRFEKFYPLDPLDLTMMAMRFGGPMTDSDEVTGEVTNDTSPHTVAGCVTFAATNWMADVNAMVDAGPESRDQGADLPGGPAPLVGEWSGPAAGAFYEGFLKPFRTAAPQQVNYAHQLHVGAVLYRNAVREGVAAINRVADACDEALSGGGTQWPDPLEVLAVASGILGYVPGPIGIGADVVGLGLDLYSLFTESAPSSNPPAVEVSGTNPVLFLESAWEALQKVEDGLADVDEALNTALNAALEDPAGFDSDALRIARPDLANSQNPSADFGSLTVPSGGPIENSQVVATIVDVYMAGYVNLPGAAGEYANAAEIMAQCELPGYLTWYFQRSPIRWEMARSRLAQIFQSMVSDLSDCGAALVEVATSYDTSDAEAVTIMGHIKEIQPPVDRTEPVMVGNVPYVVN